MSCPWQRKSPNITVGEGKSYLESNPTPTRNTQKAQTKLVYTRTQRLYRGWVRQSFECLSVSWGGMVYQWHTVSGCSRPGPCTVYHKPSWKRSSLAPPQSCQADDPQTAEQLYQRNSCTAKKVLGPTTDFPTWGSKKGTENSQGIWLWSPVGFDYRISTVVVKQTLGRHKQNLVHTRSQKKEQCPHKRLSQTCLLVSSSLWGWSGGGFTVAYCRVRGTEKNSACTSPLKGCLL